VGGAHARAVHRLAHEFKGEKGKSALPRCAQGLEAIEPAPSALCTDDHIKINRAFHYHMRPYAWYRRGSCHVLPLLGYK